MHDITDLPAWERLFKKIVWKQLGDMKGKKILDFVSGEVIRSCIAPISVANVGW